MKSLALLVAGGCASIVSACSIPFGASNVGPATVGGYFPAAKGAMWAYDTRSTQLGTTTPTHNFIIVQVDNVSRTGDIYSIVGSSELFSAMKLTPTKAYMSIDEEGEQIPLPLTSDSTWVYGPSSARIQAKVTEDDISVPAGTFHALHIVYRPKGVNSTAIQREMWLADGIGIVRVVDYRTATTSFELASYHL